MSESFTLSSLAPMSRWVLWRNEQTEGRATKIPKQITGKKASSTTPATWATRAECEAARARIRADGVGIVLGDLGNGYHLAGIDLDSCITEGATAAWAQEVLDQFGTYAETSPSGTGYKAFFLLPGGDMPSVLDLLGGKQGRSWKQAGGEHPPAIEFFTGGRYFTVTDKALGEPDLAIITPDEIAWLTRFAAETFSPPREAGDNGRDNSRSARAFDIAGRIRAGGGSYADFIAACRADENCHAWLLEKGLANDEREAQRAWQNASKAGRADNSPGRRQSSVTLLRADMVKSEPIAWLWPGWLARAKVHIFGGDPGAGKTTVALDMAATVSRGGRWPDGTSAEPGEVLFWSGEDDPSDTLKPRLERAGADLARVHFIAGAAEDGRKRAFDPAKDMAGLSDAIAAMQSPALLVVDPIVSAIAGDSHNNAEVRRGLQPLADLAIERRVAVLGIHHLSKGSQGRKPLERVTGSLAFGALARLVFFAARGEIEEAERLFVRVKSNIGPDGDGFRYSLAQAALDASPDISASGIVWGGAVKGRAADLLARLEGVEEPGKGSGGGGGDSPALSDAKAFLETMLADGPMLQKLLEAEAKEAGVSWSTVRRAKTALGITSERIAPKPASDDGPASEGAWQWCFPAAGLLAKMRAEAQGEGLDHLP